MTTTPEQRAALRERAEWIRDHTYAAGGPSARVIVDALELLDLLDELEQTQAAR